MKNNMVYVVTSGRHYENGEEYFGCDGVFPTHDAARSYVQKDFEETLSAYETDSFNVTDEDDELRAMEYDGQHEFFWIISQHAVQPDSEAAVQSQKSRIPKVIVSIDGGALQSVHSTQNISVELLDYDNMRVAEDDELARYEALEDELKNGQTEYREWLLSVW